MNGERREDQVEGTLGQRFAQVLQAQVGARQAGHGEHVLAGVHAGELRLRMALEHAPGGDARPGPELEHPARVDPLGRPRDLGLHAVVVGHLVADDGDVGLGIPVELAHPGTVPGRQAPDGRPTCSYSGVGGRGCTPRDRLELLVSSARLVRAVPGVHGPQHGGQRDRHDEIGRRAQSAS